MDTGDNQRTGDDQIRVEMALDLICVHSYIGYNRLARTLARYRAGGGRVAVVFRPFELAPGAPTDGAPLLEVLARSFGDSVVRQLGHMVTEAAKDGIDLRYDRAIATGTFEAHRLVALASRQERGEVMVERLFRAHFTDGLNIGDPAILSGLAAELGVTVDGSGAEQVKADLIQVRRLGVTGVPVFWFAGRPALRGEQPEELLFAALEEARRRAVTTGPDR
jgi:predicted DsbA family dithiol-disulfide isomerase